MEVSLPIEQEKELFVTNHDSNPVDMLCLLTSMPILLNPAHYT